MNLNPIELAEEEGAKEMRALTGWATFYLQEGGLPWNTSGGGQTELRSPLHLLGGRSPYVLHLASLTPLTCKWRHSRVCDAAGSREDAART